MTRTQRTWIVGTALAALVVAANASSGAYFSRSWGWVALALLAPTTLLLIFDRVTKPGRLRIVFTTFVGALAVWIALSVIWSVSTSGSVREIERVLVYLALALAVALALRRGDAPAVVAGAFGGASVVCVYALATRLFPERLETSEDPFNAYRLAEPIGYWNALGLLAAVTFVSGLGVVAHARRWPLAVASAAVLPVAASTLYFTFSRGAWLALGSGLVASVVLDARRLRLLWTALAIALPSAAAIAYASRKDALTTVDAPVSAATREGQRVALAVAVLAVASMGAAACARFASARWSPTRRTRRGVDVALATLAAATVAAGLIAVGGPRSAFDEVRAGFNSAPVTGSDLNDRLFSFSGNGRSEQLRVAWDAGRERVVTGNGAGAFEYLWYENRPNLLVVRDGHSLYMESFAELGLVGVALLAGALLTLLIAALRARRARLVAAGAGGLAAWAAASALDWHWEMVGVTLTALLLGTGGLLASERGAPGARIGSRARLSLACLTAALSVCAVWSLVANQALHAGREAVDRGRWQEAQDHARRAQTLLPWSHEPELVLGDAAAGGGDRRAALVAYRRAVEVDSRNWVAWLRLAQVARGDERRIAYGRVRELNPLEGDLPGATP